MNEFIVSILQINSNLESEQDGKKKKNKIFFILTGASHINAERTEKKKKSYEIY
jgi:hypothetical protein